MRSSFGVTTSTRGRTVADVSITTRVNVGYERRRRSSSVALTIPLLIAGPAGVGLAFAGSMARRDGRGPRPRGLDHHRARRPPRGVERPRRRRHRRHRLLGRRPRGRRRPGERRRGPCRRFQRPRQGCRGQGPGRVRPHRTVPGSPGRGDSTFTRGSCDCPLRLWRLRRLPRGRSPRHFGRARLPGGRLPLQDRHDLPEECLGHQPAAPLDDTHRRLEHHRLAIDFHAGPALREGDQWSFVRRYTRSGERSIFASRRAARLVAST